MHIGHVSRMRLRLAEHRSNGSWPFRWVKVVASNLTPAAHWDQDEG